MFYEDVLRGLNRARVDYVVAGGVALVLHGVVRLTADIDLMVNLNEKNLLKFVTVMTGLGYKPRVPVKAEDLADVSLREKWIKDKGMKVFSFFHSKSPWLIDVFINEPIKYETIKKHSVAVKAGNLTIPIVSVEDLIGLKRISGRPQDIADIEALKEIKKHDR